MNQDEIKRTILANLERAGLADADVRVQPDTYSGWRIAVTCSGFEDMSFSERRKNAFAGLDNIQIEWYELLAPQERQWFGQSLAELDDEGLPLWPEALARGQGIHGELHFPSELDEDLSQPVCVSFYSLRGGVGRSTALAYTGKILAAKGLKVVCVDMDLEAPGLAALFDCEPYVEPHQGVAELLVKIDQGEKPDITKHLIKVNDDDLYCLPAGVPSADYARKLRFIDPVSWYREELNPLRLLIEMIETKLPFTPDVILLDSRTGITPLSGPLLFDLADISIITFYPHPQAEAGTRALVRALLNSKTRRSLGNHRLTPEPRFLVSPVPSSKITEVKARYHHRAMEWIEQWLQPALNRDTTFDTGDITHFISYKEALATSDSIMDDDLSRDEYEPIVQWIQRFLATPSEKQIASSMGNMKPLVLDELHFSTGTAEQQEDFFNTFVQTDVVKKAVAHENPLVTGRKGTGKTAIFRWMMEKSHSAVIHAPPPLNQGKPWILTSDGFAAIGEKIEVSNVGWRQFWTFYICLALYLQNGNRILPPNLSLPNPEVIKTDSDVARLFEKWLTQDQLSLELNDWLIKIDQSLKSKTVILFDGLDVGFGSAPKDRERRNNALAGLFDYWMNWESRLSNIVFKIFLREDLWNTISFENKSHLFGRMVQLKWKEQLTYYRVAIKQAIRSTSFMQVLKSLDGENKQFDRELESWPDNDVQTAWNLLVGERMKGGKTAFTRNWVWSRLADGKNDHSPRYLLQLLNQIVIWEKSEHVKSPYERSIIRPRAMEKCLPEVSKEAIGALSEEFRELKDFIGFMEKEVDRTPISANLVKQRPELSIAVEAGLLEVYEGTPDKPERYKVPDLFRHALKLTRKGQF